MRALITGGGGQLASDLAELLGEDAVAMSRSELDITEPSQLQAALAEIQPELILNCAAFHNLDVCEQEPDQAWATNVRAVRELASTGIPLVHLSTNYVFDGTAAEPYAEDDLPNPRSIYALTKLAGEYAALAYGERTLVVRTAGLYGLQGSVSKGGNFVQRMVARARSDGRLRMVADQRLQPTWTGELARSIIDAVGAGATGVVHLVADGECSWFQFTQAIMELAGIAVEIEPVETTRSPGQVDRPLNGVLARPRADSLGLARLSDWHEQLERYMSLAGLTADAAASP